MIDLNRWIFFSLWLLFTHISKYTFTLFTSMTLLTFKGSGKVTTFAYKTLDFGITYRTYGNYVKKTTLDLHLGYPNIELQ